MGGFYRGLAAAVLLRALSEAHGRIGYHSRKWDRRGPEEIQAEARAFFDPDNALYVGWCDVVDIDPVALAERLFTEAAAAVARQAVVRPRLKELEVV